uniref:rRNA N-glycosidase n=1 Tax=Aegilops tauschii subsp. strangulata TaxID=200361 RepID=A0A453M940_AEGTS
MAEAVNALAARTAADAGSGAKQQQAREAVVALLLMVNEAARFQTVSGFVAGLMHPRAAKNKGTITGEMKAQVNGWQDLSAALLKTDKKSAPEGPATFTAFDKMGVKTADQAAATLGILLFVAVEGGTARDKALQLFRGTPNY